MSKYNGLSNYETWNVILWLSNDEGLYEFAKGFRSYELLADSLVMSGLAETPDGVSFDSLKLNHEELETFLEEIS